MRKPGRGAQVEGQHRRARHDHLLVALFQVLVSGLGWFDEYLAEREGGGEHLVFTFDHTPPERRDPLCPFAPVLDEVHEEIRVPEDLAHPHPSRSRST